MHVELVGVDLALDHQLAESPRGGDEHHVLEARLGIDGERHPARAQVAPDHALDAGRERDVRVREALVRAVGDRAVVEQRGEHLADRVHHGVRALHVEQRLLLPGEGRLGQVLRGGGGAHRHRAVLAAGRHPRIVRAQLALQGVGQGRRPDPATDLVSGGRERPYVGDVEVREPPPDPLREPVTSEKLPERIRGGGEPPGHAHPGRRQLADHLAERGVLAPHPGHVGHAQSVEGNDSFHMRSAPVQSFIPGQPEDARIVRPRRAARPAASATAG